jgi:hypothetical protein
MKIVVIGGTGLIGTKVVGKLKSKGHEGIAAAPNTGVNTIAGEGLAEALTNARASSRSSTAACGPTRRMPRTTSRGGCSSSPTMHGDYLFGDRPSVVDLYLFVTLLWADKFGVDVPERLVALRHRLEARPAVRAALKAEGLR